MTTWSRVRDVIANTGLVVGVVAAAASLLFLQIGNGFHATVFGLRVSTGDVSKAMAWSAAGFSLHVLLRREWRWRRHEPRTERWHAGTVAAMAGILLLAAVVRFWGIGFGLPHPNARPDEGAVGAIAGSYYLGAHNPKTFTYPPVYLQAVANAMRLQVFIEQRLPEPLRSQSALAVRNTVTNRLIARVISAAAGVASVWVLYLVGARLFRRQTGLCAAAFLALAYLHVRDSHFGVTDVSMTFMAVAAFAAVVRMLELDTLGSLAIAAALTGLATATKYNAAFVVLPASFAILMGPAERPLTARAGRLVLFGAIMIASFVLVDPFAVLDYPHFLADVRHEGVHLAAGHGFDLGRGWTYHFTTTLRYGLGAPLLAASVAGLALLLWREPRKGVLVLLFPIGYYLLAGSGFTVFVRYMLPVVPFLCLTAGYAAVLCAEWLSIRFSRPAWLPAIATLVVAGLIWPSALSIWRFDRLVARPDNRVLVRRWVEERFPAGTTIAQIGSEGGHPFLQDGNEVSYVVAEFTPRAPLPQIVILQSSPLKGPADLGEMRKVLVDSYDRQFAPDAAGEHPANVYDRQDEFYLPFAGFKAIERPGPNLEVYVRRGAQASFRSGAITPD